MNQTFERQDIGYLLTAYADGQLAPEGVMWVEEQLDRNPDLRARLKEIRHLQAGLRTAFAGGAPEFVLDLPRRDALLASAANPPRKRIRFPAPMWIGLAASVMAVVYVGMQLSASPDRSGAYAYREEAGSATFTATPAGDFADGRDVAGGGGFALRDLPAAGYSSADETDRLAKADRDAATRSFAGERRLATAEPASPMRPAAPVAAAPPAPTAPAPADASLARTDRGGLAAAKKHDGNRAAPSAPPVTRPVEGQLQEYAGRSAQDAPKEARKAEQAAVPAQPRATPTPPGAGPRVAKDKAVEQVPVEPSEADVVAPINQLGAKLDEKTSSDDAQGRDEAVAASETGSTGAFMAVGAGRRSIAKKEIAEQQASSAAQEVRQVLTGDVVVNVAEDGEAVIAQWKRQQAAAPGEQARAGRALADLEMDDPRIANGVAPRSLLDSTATIDPQQSLAALRAPVTLDGRLGLAQSLRLIGGEKIGFSLTTSTEGLLERQVQVSLRNEPAARGVLRAVRSAGLQAQFTGGLVRLDSATRPLDPADAQGFDLPTFKDLFGTAPMQATAVDAIQTVAIDADTATYEYAKARVASGQPVDPATIKPEHFINAMPMDYPPAQGPEAFSLYAEAAPSPFARANTAWGPRTALVSIGAVAKPAAADERKPLALTLAIDCSGSMAQAGGLDRIRRGLSAFIEHLRAEDRVSIVAFGDQARVILPATPGNDRAALTNALATLTTGGATNAAEGLGLAYQLAAETAAPGVESRVLLATDGGTVAGADDLLRRVTAFKDRGITLVVVGTGQTYRAGPLQDLATKGDGQHFYVGSDDAAEALFTGRLLPDRLAVLAKDAKLQVTWNPQRVSHARLIGYDQRRLAARDFRDNTVDAGELSQDTQVTALFEVLLVDGGAGPLGTAAVRYRDMRRDQVRELACPLPGTILQSQPSDRLRLLACAAATAEWLQRGWWSNVHLITPEEIRAQLARCPQAIAHELRAMLK